MVDPEAFEEARRLLAEAIDEAYLDSYLIPPIELSKGQWVFWPTRMVNLKLEEARFWSYGQPGAGTGKLQAHIEQPYGQHERIRPKKSGVPFGRKEAERAAKAARSISDHLAEYYHYKDEAAQEAYIIAYEAVENAKDEDLQPLWHVRRATWTDQRANWDTLHHGIWAFLKMEHSRRGVLEWSPGEPERAEVWKPLEEKLGDTRLYDLAMRGVLDALDDWAVRKGFLVVNNEGDRVIPE